MGTVRDTPVDQARVRPVEDLEAQEDCSRPEVARPSVRKCTVDSIQAWVSLRISVLSLRSPLTVKTTFSLEGTRQYTPSTKWRPPNALYLWHAEVHRRWTSVTFTLQA